MFDALSFTEIDGQHVELLPARTVMSLFGTHGAGGNCTANTGDSSGLVSVLNNNSFLNNNNILPILQNGVVGILNKGMC